MIGFSIEVTARIAAQALQQAANINPDRLDKAVENTAIETAHEIRTQADFPRDLNNLYNSVMSRRSGEMAWSVSPHVNYAEYVHQGTRPGGWVPFFDLYDWVKRKGIQPRNPKWSLDDLTFAIRRSIYRNGTPKQPFMQTVIDSGWVQERLNRNVGNAVSGVLSEAGL